MNSTILSTCFIIFYLLKIVNGLSFIPSNRATMTKVRAGCSILSMSTITKNKKDNDAIVIPKSYNVAAGFFIVSALTTVIAHNYVAGVPIGLISILLGVQTGII
jgi:hypothetical protein